MPDVLLDQFAILSFYDTVQTAVGESLWQDPGISEPVEDGDEWVTANVLNTETTVQMGDQYGVEFLFQVSCFSVKGEERSDGSTVGHLALLGTVRNALRTQPITVRKLGPGGDGSDVGGMTLSVGNSQVIDGDQQTKSGLRHLQLATLDVIGRFYKE